MQLSDASRLNNPGLRPEKQNSIEFGIESKFFNDRLSFEAAYYNSVTSEQILNADISDATGYNEKVINAGSLTNNGLEFQLGISPIKKEGGFQWNIMANLSRNWNKVDIDNPITLASYWGINFDVNKDYPYGSFFGKDFQRDPNGNIIHQNGLPIYANNNSYLGTTTPKWFGGVTNSFSFKGITASALIDFKQGGSVYSVTNTWGRYAGALEETVKGREGGIVGDGVILNGDGTYRPNDVVVSSQAYNQKMYVNAVHSSSVFDASYVKFREAQIAYSLPSGLLSKTPFTKASLGIQARNLAILFKNAPHIDPETSFSNGNIQGMEFGQIPTARSIGFNINLTL